MIIEIASLLNDDNQLQDDTCPPGNFIPDGDTVVVELYDGEPQIARHDPDCVVRPTDGYHNNPRLPDKIVRGTFDRDAAVLKDITLL